MNIIGKLKAKLRNFISHDHIGEAQMAACASRIANLEAQVKYLHQRVHNPRWFAIEELSGYLVGAQIPGDYCEFGVYRGNTFGHCVKLSIEALPQMRFIAFDSFQGLPPPKGIDAEDAFTSNFHEGEFACDEATFLKNVKENFYHDISRVVTVPGWFDKTLNDHTAEKLGLTKIAAAWVDGDLYESTVPVLNFLTARLSVGSALIFDDWHVYRNLPTRGAQLACREWLERNPGLEIAPLFSFGHHGEIFTVKRLPK